MSRASPASRLRATLDLCDTGIELMRANLRRAAPGIADEEIDVRLRAWMRERPLVSPGERAPHRLPQQPPLVTGFEAALREVTDHLTHAGVRFALIGGLSLESVKVGSVRSTLLDLSAARS